MSNIPGAPGTPGTPGVPARRETTTHSWSETKSALKTTEFYAWIVVSLAILIASALVDNGEDGQGFGADHAWQYVAIVTAAYIVSRGIAKAGVHKSHDDSHTVGR
jgi:hypothetical protein